MVLCSDVMYYSVLTILYGDYGCWHRPGNWWHMACSGCLGWRISWCTIQCCSVLYCTVFWCTVLFCTVRWCMIADTGAGSWWHMACCDFSDWIVSWCTVQCCSVLYCTVFWCAVLFCTVGWCMHADTDPGAGDARTAMAAQSGPYRGVPVHSILSGKDHDRRLRRSWKHCQHWQQNNFQPPLCWWHSLIVADKVNLSMLIINHNCDQTCERDQVYKSDSRETIAYQPHTCYFWFTINCLSWCMPVCSV